MVLALVSGALARSPEKLGDVTVTEFMSEPDAVADYFGEWFEIKNTSGAVLDINGLVIRDDGADAIVVSTSTVLAPGEYVVFGVENDTAKNGNIPIDFEYSYYTAMKLDKTGDELILEYDGILLDELRWDSTWTIPITQAWQAGVGYGEIEWANDKLLNWCASSTYIAPKGLKGTPGTTNEVCTGGGSDGDGDGYTEAQGDCDDTDPEVNPGEVDGAEAPYGNYDDDRDCDGTRDDGVLDMDGDGYAPVDGDCNDDNALVNPGKTEGKVADSVDNDCNCYVDDIDADGDKYPYIVGLSRTTAGIPDADVDPVDGIPDQCILASEGDCDDTPGSGTPINPGAKDTPYDGIDQDCDGEDLCDVDGDNFEAEGCGGPDCDDEDADIHPGAPDASAEPDGKDNDCDGYVDTPDADGDGFTVASGDCDDFNAAVSPGITEDNCADELDNDCDGFYNDGCSYPALNANLQGGGVFCGTDPASAVMFGAFAGLAALAFRSRASRKGDACCR